MTKQLYIIDYENAHWCGGGLHVCVWAEDARSAHEEASIHMDEEQRELFSSEIEEAVEEDERFDDGYMYAINSIEVLNEQHEFWAYYQDEQQRAAFYPTIGSPD
jgi:hypothetical protein